MSSGYLAITPGSPGVSTDAVDYWSKQVVMVFASASARDTALSGVLREGMVAYLSDVNSLTVYSGSTWSTIGPVHGAGITDTLTVTQGASVSFTVVFAQHWRLGRMIFLNAQLAITSSGTASNDVVIGGHPASATGVEIVGTYEIVDSSTIARYTGTATAPSSTTIKFYRGALAAVGTYQGSDFGTNGFNAALANGDYVCLNLAYPAAADA